MITSSLNFIIYYALNSFLLIHCSNMERVSHLWTIIVDLITLSMPLSPGALVTGGTTTENIHTSPTIITQQMHHPQSYNINISPTIIINQHITHSHHTTIIHHPQSYNINKSPTIIINQHITHNHHTTIIHHPQSNNINKSPTIIINQHITHNHHTTIIHHPQSSHDIFHTIITKHTHHPQAL